MSVLDKIIQERKQSLPGADQVKNFNPEPGQKNVLEILKKENKLRLIAELKRKSPSQGIINPEMTVAKAVELYKPFASAMSILTEPNYFGGSLKDLQEASSLTDIPLLRKDFIIDPVQVTEARHYGADFYLLIVAALSKNQLSELLEAGHEWNMPALVEVHNEEEAEIALSSGAEILGINNRNLHDLSIDLSTTNRICKHIEKELNGIRVISESGLKTRADLEALPQVVDGVLIGTGFMKSADPQKILQEMFT